jgi:phage-related minor tail protein
MVFDLLARDRASSEVRKVGDSMDDAGGRSSKFGQIVTGAMLAAGAAVVGAAAGLYKVGETFDDMADTIRVGTGATGAALDDLTASAKNVGSEVPASFDEIGSTIADVNTRLGLTGPVLEELSGQILNAGRLLGEEVDVAGLSGAFSAFGVTGEQTTAVMDDLYRVSQATGVGINDLAGSVAKGAPQLQAFGFSISESAALLGSLDKAGLNSDATITALNKGMIAFAEAGREPRAALEETIGSIEGFIAKGDEASAIDLAASLFGTKGAGQFVAAVQSGTMSLDDLMAATGATTDTIDAASADTADFAEQWQLFKNEALIALEPVATRVFGVLGDGMTWIRDTGAPALSTAAGVVSDKLGPAFDTVSTFVTDTLMPALGDLGTWMQDNQTTMTVIAGVITGVLAAAFGVWATRATIAAVTNTIAWFTTAAAAQGSAAAQGRSALQVVVGWVMMGAQALVRGAWIAAVWLAQTAVATGALVIGWTVAAASTVASWAVMGAQALARGIAIAAVWIAQTAITTGTLLVSWGIAAATVIGGWVLMGVQSLIQAARMAAAWLIAMGPVGWIIAAVIGLVALIIANWETVKTFTVNLWNSVVGWVVGAWNSIKTGVSNGITSVINFVRELPGKVLSAIGNLGNTLLTAGGDLLRGLWNGISGSISWLKDKVMNWAGSLLPGWVKDILGIRSPSTVFAGFGRETMRGFALGIDDAAPDAINAAGAAAAAAADAALGEVVRMGTVSDEVWNRLRAQGWKGRAGDSMEALYRPAAATSYTPPRYDMGGSGGTPGGGASRTVNVSGVVGPEEVAAIVRREQARDEFLTGVW